MTDYGARIAASAGDAGALLALAIELLQENAQLVERAALLEHRRELDAARSHRRRVKSRDVTCLTVTPRDGAVVVPPPPGSPSFPTPHITLPSPTPSQPSTAREVEFGQEYPVAPAILTGRYGAVVRGAMTDEEWQLVERFLATRPPTQQGDWLREIAKLIGPASGCTPADVDCALSDALLLQTPLRSAHALRVFVRTSRDERRKSASAGPAESGQPAGSAADRAWDAVLEMLPAWQRREVTAETHADLPAGTRRGLSKIGGFGVIQATPTDKRVWLKRDFVAAYSSPAKVPA